MQIKLIFTRKSRKALHLASFWKWGFGNSEMVYWGWRDAWYDQTIFTVFEILPWVFILHSSRLRRRSFGSSRNPPQGQVGQEHVTHPYERRYWRLPAIRRSFFFVRGISDLISKKRGLCLNTIVQHNSKDELVRLLVIKISWWFSIFDAGFLLVFLIQNLGLFRRDLFNLWVIC